MNKAFVREPDDTGAGHCPRCGSLGIAVGAETLAAQLVEAGSRATGRRRRFIARFRSAKWRTSINSSRRWRRIA